MAIHGRWLTFPKETSWEERTHPQACNPGFLYILRLIRLPYARVIWMIIKKTDFLLMCCKLECLEEIEFTQLTTHASIRISDQPSGERIILFLSIYKYIISNSLFSLSLLVSASLSISFPFTFCLSLYLFHVCFIFSSLFLSHSHTHSLTHTLFSLALDKNFQIRLFIKPDPYPVLMGGWFV